ncbi:hypothetical protein C8R32_11122 [Nitrosospira sp. Nsp5]|uniref:Uncharacterized protein n=1 Tax=Nitrosospira multiformis TaxID=1231 RepID=A0ABY0TBK0_9PROT|nr:hypothetical protein C8R32_11122 [Nitrosospira sp. Nsp5]SDQ58304.1 hypothetical protein SAMN05216402_1419 [Nitrosospira multiformis]
MESYDLNTCRRNEVKLSRLAYNSMNEDKVPIEVWPSNLSGFPLCFGAEFPMNPRLSALLDYFDGTLLGTRLGRAELGSNFLGGRTDVADGSKARLYFNVPSIVVLSAAGRTPSRSISSTPCLMPRTVKNP